MRRSPVFVAALALAAVVLAPAVPAVPAAPAGPAAGSDASCMPNVNFPLLGVVTRDDLALVVYMDLAPGCLGRNAVTLVHVPSNTVVDAFDAWLEQRITDEYCPPFAGCQGYKSSLRVHERAVGVDVSGTFYRWWDATPGGYMAGTVRGLPAAFLITD